MNDDVSRSVVSGVVILLTLYPWLPLNRLRSRETMSNGSNSNLILPHSKAVWNPNAFITTLAEPSIRWWMSNRFLKSACLLFKWLDPWNFSTPLIFSSMDQHQLEIEWKYSDRTPSHRSKAFFTSYINKRVPIQSFTMPSSCLESSPMGPQVRGRGFFFERETSLIVSMGVHCWFPFSSWSICNDRPREFSKREHGPWRLVPLENHAKGENKPSVSQSLAGFPSSSSLLLLILLFQMDGWLVLSHSVVPRDLLINGSIRSHDDKVTIIFSENFSTTHPSGLWPTPFWVQ